MNESGWGEFEILIKVYFHDPAEKPQLLYHHLELYPKTEGVVNTKKPVLVEAYDEIV